MTNVPSTPKVLPALCEKKKNKKKTKAQGKPNPSDRTGNIRRPYLLIVYMV